MKLLTDRYQADLLGALSCYDRMIITGTLLGACYAGGMTSFLNSLRIKIFDYAKVFADPWCDRLRQCAHELAEQHGITIEHVNKPHIRKKDLIAKVNAQRGKHPGLVHILFAMDACSAYKPWHDKNSHKTFLRPTSGKCLHYYFYFINEEVGLCYLRVPTWCPFRLQFYCNGHSWLETKLAANGIDYAMADNAFIRIDDFVRAQSLADQLKLDDLHRIFDRYAKMCCPEQEVFGQQYHWNLMRAEYSTDLTFRHDAVLSSRYSDGHRVLRELTHPKIEQGIHLRGFNFFDATKQALLLAIQRVEFNLHGLRRADLKKYLPSVSSGKLSRYLKRLRVFGLIKRVAKTNRYYPTRIGRAAVATCEKLTEFTIVQTLAVAR